MNKFILNIYMKIIRSVKIHMYILFNCFITLGYFLMDYMSTKDIDKIDYGTDLVMWYEYHIVSLFGNSIYFVTLGLLLWLFILLEIIRYFRTNQDLGILLTHIVRPIKRSKYYFSVLLAIFYAFTTVVIINILMSFFVTMIFFDFYSVALIKMLFVSIIYGIIHVACITIILSFLVLLIKQSELSIIVSGIFVLFISFSIVLKFPLNNISLDQFTLNFISLFTFSDSYPFLYLTKDIFNVFNEPLALERGIKIEFYEMFNLITNFKNEPDLGFPLLKQNMKQIFYPYYIMIFALGFNGLLLFASIRLFNKMDIT